MDARSTQSSCILILSRIFHLPTFWFMPGVRCDKMQLDCVDLVSLRYSVK